MTAGIDSGNGTVGGQQKLQETGSRSGGNQDTEWENRSPRTVAQAMAEYDSLGRRFFAGALAAQRLDWLGATFNSGNLNPLDCCKLLDHALPDLVSDPEGGFPLSEQIQVILDLALSRKNDALSDRDELGNVMDWIAHLKNPRIQAELLDGAGHWLSGKYQPAEIITEMERIPAAGGRDRLAAAYLQENGLTDSSQPLRDYLNFADLVGEGRCLGNFSQFPGQTDFSKLPELLMERKTLPSSRVLAGLLSAWGSADSTEVAKFVRDHCDGPDAGQLVSAVARMVEDSEEQALSLAGEFPPSPEKDAWLSEALSHSRRFSREDGMALASQIGNPSLREEMLRKLSSGSDPISDQAR